MFERHFGLRENPFAAGHQLRFLYPSREHQEARAHLRYGIENREPFLLITGEVGTGKTTAIYDALAEWGNQVTVALITNSALNRQELLEEICLRFGMAIPPGTSKPQALVQLERHLVAVRSRGEFAVLLLDEAQNLSTELLEEIRLLSNLETQGEKLVQIFLVGQPELEIKLARPELRQLRQRITVHYRLNPLSPDETAGYIHHRISVAGGNAWVIFPPDACREVYRFTHGIPREINTVASAALVAGFTENSPSVKPEHVAAVAAESEFKSVIAPSGAPVPPAPSMALEPPPAPVVAPPPPVQVAPPPPPVAAAPPPPPVVETPPPPPPVAETPRAADPSESVERAELEEWTTARNPKDTHAEPTPEPVAPAPPPPAPVAPPPVEPARVEVRSAPRSAPPPPPPAPRIASRAMERIVPTPGSAMSPPPAPDRWAAPAAAPPPPSRPAPAESRPTPLDLASLSPRLRDKLMDGLDDEPRASGPPGWIVGLAVLAIVVIGLVLLQRFHLIDLPLLRGIAGKPAVTVPTATQAQQAPAPTPVDSLAPATPSPSATQATPAKASPPPAATPVATSPPKLPATKPASATKPAAPRPDSSAVFSLDVGSYLNEERAREESARIAGATRQPARLVAYDESGATMYRIVLGSYAARTAAEQAAERFTSNGVVREARVFRVPRRR